MYRKAEKNILKWFKETNKKPLVLRGARQVGKSTLVRQFCANNKIDLFEINFEITKLTTLKTLEGFDIDEVLGEIETRCKKEFRSGKSLIFFDEIQSSPVALQSLRYFYESNRNLSIIAAGSLLEFLLDDHKFSMPVGRVEYMHLSPMTFFEFLHAMGEEILARKLEKSNFKDWQTFHEKLLKLLRTYYFVGGMPEAVKVYGATHSALKTSNIHRSILQTYKDDFSKYKSRIGIEKISSFFEKIPNCLGKKVKFSNIFPEEKSATVTKLVDLFIKARIILPCYHSNGAAIPLLSQKDDSVFKLYFLDIGLLHHLHGLEAEDIIKKEGAFLTDGLSAEQFAAQHLAYASTPAEEPRLYYWLRDKKKENAELDFLISKKSSVIPVEVKAGKSGTLKSLFWFMGTYKHKTAIRMDMRERPPTDIIEKVSSSIVNQEIKVKCSFDLLNIPLYMAEQVYALLDTYGIK